MKRVVIIGAGASGLISSIFARKNKNDVTVLEKNEICGKKILMTGNGRCNFWNEDQNLVHYRSNNFEKIEKILNKNNQIKILDFFKKIGIEPKIKNGYYYPYSNQAVSIQQALILEAQKQGVKIRNKSNVIDVKKNKNEFEIFLENGEKIKSDVVIIATGSKAVPKTGSDGLGYELCRKFNHSIIKPLPALVQLKTGGKFLKEWAGIRADVSIGLIENNKKIAEEKGEIQLTNYGISGICVFNLSGRVSRGLEENKKEKVQINFLKGLNIKTLDEFIIWLDNRDEVMKNRTIYQLLEGVLNYKLVNVLLKLSKVRSQDKWKDIDNNLKIAIAKNIVSLELDIIGTNSFEQCQVCSGGVPLCEINEYTMESKKENGLYIIGEVLDVDGDCGGYNLEWAWITGMVSGTNIQITDKL